MHKQSFTRSAAFRAAPAAFLFAALFTATAAYAQREKTSPPPSATPDAPTLGVFAASAAPGDAMVDGKEVVVPRKLLWRIHIYERAFHVVKKPTDRKATDPSPSAISAIAPVTNPGAPDAPSADAPARESAPPATVPSTPATPPAPMVKASFGVQVENDSPYELTALTIELQIIGQDGKSQSVRRDISLRNAKTNEPLLAFPPNATGVRVPTLNKFDSPTEISADFFKGGYKAYWMIVRGARGIHHRYSTNAGKALVEAAMRDDAPIAGRVLKARSKVITTRDDKGEDMMQVATENESSDVIPILLKHGAQVDSLTADRQTPLMLAANGDLTRVVKVLIDAHANLSYQEPSTGNTALHLVAVSTGFDSTGARIAMIRLLLKAFADPKIKNKEGKTPLDLTADPKVREALAATVPSAPPPPAEAPAASGRTPPPPPASDELVISDGL